MSKIGLGIVTYNRPEYLRQCMAGVIKHLLPLAGEVIICNDGSSEEQYKTYRSVYSELPREIVIYNFFNNRGVAGAKNTLLRHLIAFDCEYIFLLEDDIVPDSPMAFMGYIEASKATGIEHLSFAHHGDMNPGPLATRGSLELYPNAVGAYCFYTRKVIESVGYFDEHFKNAWEHVEHTNRIAKAGLTTPFWLFADATGSEKWLHEIPGSLEHSSRRDHPELNQWIADGMAYWRQKDGGPPPRPASITL